MIDARAIAAQLKAQQDVMDANFQQEKESLLNVLKEIQRIRRETCLSCGVYSAKRCNPDNKECSWHKVRNILKGVLHEI